MQTSTSSANRSPTGFDLSPPGAEQRRDLEAALMPEEREVLLEHGTEAPFCGVLLDNKSPGTYCCKLCGLPLFRAAEKFESGTGWPSFTAPFDQTHLKDVTDTSHAMQRTEIVCSRCGSHLGHVFPDGPPPSGRRYCINSVSLEFVHDGALFPDKLGRCAHEGVHRS